MVRVSSSSNRILVLVLLGGIFFGIMMFFVGRFSVSIGSQKIISTTSTSAGILNKKSSSPKMVGAPMEKSVTTTFDWRDSWNKLYAQPRTPAGIAALAAMLEKLAASDPTQAMSIAQDEKNLLLKD